MKRRLPSCEIAIPRGRAAARKVPMTRSLPLSMAVTVPERSLVTNTVPAAAEKARAAGKRPQADRTMDRIAGGTATPRPHPPAGHAERRRVACTRGAAAEEDGAEQ